MKCNKCLQDVLVDEMVLRKIKRKDCTEARFQKKLYDSYQEVVYVCGCGNEFYVLFGVLEFEEPSKRKKVINIFLGVEQKY